MLGRDNSYLLLFAFSFSLSSTVRRWLEVATFDVTQSVSVAEREVAWLDGGEWQRSEEAGNQK